MIVETPRHGEVVVKRGAIKAFREYLNERFRYSERHQHDGGGRHRYQQRVREYGDYLYSQDREMFMYELSYALDGQFEGFKASDWCSPKTSEPNSTEARKK